MENTIEKLNKIKTQLNRIESLVKRLLEEEDVYVPTQSEKSEISRFSKQVNSDAKDQFCESNDYVKFTHKKESKWQPITDEMKVLLEAMDRLLYVPEVTQEDKQFIKQMLDVTDGTDGQFKKINALVYKLYNS